MSVVLSITGICTWTIGDPKPAHTSPYDGMEPVLLPTKRSHIDLETYSCNSELKIKSEFGERRFLL